MRKTLTIILFILILHVNKTYSQEIEILSAIPSETIKVKASSEFENCKAREAIYGNGMQNHFRQSDRSGESMWMTEISEKSVKANSYSQDGVAWLFFEFENPIKIDLLEIWKVL